MTFVFTSYLIAFTFLGGLFFISRQQKKRLEERMKRANIHHDV